MLVCFECGDGNFLWEKCLISVNHVGETLRLGAYECGNCDKDVRAISEELYNRRYDIDNPEQRWERGNER